MKWINKLIFPLAFWFQTLRFHQRKVESRQLSLDMALLAGIGATVVLLTVSAWWYLRIPSDMPKNIPTVPFYVSSIARFIDFGQDEIYDRWLREPLEKYGAVKFWFSSQWTVLLAKPEYINDLLRNENVFTKEGNSKRIPFSVIAAFLGNNIISAHGETWKLYTSIMKAGIQRRITDTSKLLGRSKQLVRAILQSQEAAGEDFGIDLESLVSRYTIYIVGEHFLQTDFEVCRILKLAELETPDPLNILTDNINRTSNPMKQRDWRSTRQLSEPAFFRHCISVFPPLTNTPISSAVESARSES